MSIFSFLPKPKILPLDRCHFNIISLRCPKCKIAQNYSNTEICGDKFIVCDYCSFDIPFIYNNHPYNSKWNEEIRKFINRTVIARI